ncbi:hypothetical protein DH2020_049971 [Rehmannia glutinosa]|uniref:Protein kinase domain-containing protein n=1 Tax=Rehmannia glutinosa TaxID=99300 RepID=A0ABR0U277_REHGL
MHWWQGAFTSTSKSHSSDDSVILGDRASEAASSCSVKSGFFSSRRNRMLARARKLRQVTENDVEMWRSPGNLQNSSARASTSSSPQPLPLPELRVLLQRDPKFASSSPCSVPLPSPEAIHIPRGCDDKERERDRERERTEAMNAEAYDGLNELKRLVGQDLRTNAEHSETRPSRKSRQKQTAKEKYSDIYHINIPISAPATPYSSLILSPPRSDMWATKYMTPPGVFQVWSAPEMPHSDANLSLGFSCQTPSEKTACSVDNSPLQSPRRSTHQHATSPHRPPSPLTAKISSETPCRWESNAQATVHPLPLPPGPAMSSQVTPISPVGSKSDTLGACMPSQSTPISSATAKHEFPGSNIPSQPLQISPRDGALCAMKEVEILPDDSQSAECMRQLEQEIKVLSHLKHPNIVQYYGSEIVSNFLYEAQFTHESVIRNFTRHILCGLAYLHSKKTIHRDIKGANLLVDAYGVVKLADFGMAKHVTERANGKSIIEGESILDGSRALAVSTQTDASSDVALAVDIWSLGCTIIEMMNGKPPWSEYEGAAALFKVLTETPPIPNTMSADGKDFLQRCFRRNPADRPTASKLLDHPFLSCTHQPAQSLKETKSTIEKRDDGSFAEIFHGLEAVVVGLVYHAEKQRCRIMAGEKDLQNKRLRIRVRLSLSVQCPVRFLEIAVHKIDESNSMHIWEKCLVANRCRPTSKALHSAINGL